MCCSGHLWHSWDTISPKLSTSNNTTQLWSFLTKTASAVFPEVSVFSGRAAEMLQDFCFCNRLLQNGIPTLKISRGSERETFLPYIQTLISVYSALLRHTCEGPVGKLMPSSFRDLMVAPIRLSCGSFWKSSAHSTIRAFSFSHTLGWACGGGTCTQTALIQCFYARWKTVTAAQSQLTFPRKWGSHIHENDRQVRLWKKK